MADLIYDPNTTATNNASLADPFSLYSAYSESQYGKDDFLSPLSPYSSDPLPSGAPVNYANPVETIGVVPSFIRPTADVTLLDPDPFGTKTAAWASNNGLGYGTDRVEGLNVFGKAFSRSELERTEEGRRLLDVASKNRAGHKRGFLEALTDFEWSDLPFISLFASVGGSIKDAVVVGDTFKKLQNGEAVTDEELIKTRLYMAENEYRENGTWGSTVGDIIRAAPGFMLEFFASGGAYSLARTGLSKTIGTGVHLGLNRATKILARESVEALAKDAVKESSEKVAAKAFSSLASSEAGKDVVKKASEKLFNFMKMEQGSFYKGLSDDALRDVATNRAKYELKEAIARNSGGALGNGFNSFAQWLKGNVSRGIMDYGSWGTEEATVLFSRHSSAGRALADAVGTFLVEAPIKGTMLSLPNNFIAKPVIGAVVGQDGRTTSAAELSLRQAAWQTNNKSLMDNAESIAFGINLLEYISENTGRGLGSTLTAAGLGLEKAGVKGLVRPMTEKVNALGLLAESGDEAVTLGGRMRKFIADVFGTREEYRAKFSKDSLDIAAKKLGVTDAADRAALQTAIKSNSVAGLRPELQQAIGSDVSKFVSDAMDESYHQLGVKAYARFAVAKWMVKHDIGPETVMNLYNQMGYDGILGEMFEERYSDVVKGLFGLDDRAEHDFFSNLKTAVKNIYPGWDQLTAEAVGFAMPMVTRAAVMRVQSSIGGAGKVREIREVLGCLDDAMRHDSSVQTTQGMLPELMDFLSDRDTKEIAAFNGKLKEAQAAGDEALAKQLTEEIATKTKAAARRREHFQKYISSLSDIAKSNADAIVTVPLLSDATLADDAKYGLAPMINSDQAAEGLAGQTAIVEFSPELARRVAEAEAPLEGENPGMFRRIAHKVVGLAGMVVTGDLSLAASNPVHWTARDMGVSNNTLVALKTVFKDEVRRLSSLVENRDLSMSEIHDRAQANIAGKAKQIMSANLAAHQLRSFSDGRIRAQAINHVASTYTEDDDDRHYNFSPDGFYKLTADGAAIDESTLISAEEFEKQHKEAIDKAHEDIVKATVDLMTRGITASADARVRLMNSLRVSADSELLEPAIYSAAMHLIGQGNIVHRIQIDGKTPLAVAVKGYSVGTTNMSVVDYVATKDSADDVDGRAFESLARSLNIPFDGTEESLKTRNDKIFRLCKMSNLLKREGVEYFASEIPVEDELGARVSSHGTNVIRVIKNGDGYVADMGLKASGEANLVPYESWDAAVAGLGKLGYLPSTARIVFTQAKIVESTDMFGMIRDLGFGREYYNSLSKDNQSYLHPMFRKDADGKLLTEEKANEILRSELAMASRGAKADRNSDAYSVWERLWGEKGYMTIGENLLSKRAGVSKNTISKYAGEFSSYTPTRYTLSLNSGRIGNSPDIIVPIDASVDSDLASGTINALLMNAYRFNARFLKNEMRSYLGDFLGELDGLIAVRLARAEKAGDKALADSLRSVRAECTANVNRVVKGSDGKLRVLKGYGLTARAYAVLGNAFALHRAGKYKNSPFRRALADLEADVSNLPSYIPFLNIVDVTLGGNGFLDEAVRNASKVEPTPVGQRGLRALLTLTTGNAKEFADVMRGSLPLGMSYEELLDACIRKANAMSKSGAPVFDGKSAAGLREKAAAAAAAAEKAANAEARAAADAEIRERHFTFLGNLVGTMKGLVDSGVIVTDSVASFFRDLVADAKSDPNVSEKQKNAADTLARALAATAEAEVADEKAVELANENLNLRAEIDELRKQRKTMLDEQAGLQRRLKAALDNKDEEAANAIRAQVKANGENIAAVTAEMKGKDEKAREDEDAIKRTGSKAVQAALGAGYTDAITENIETPQQENSDDAGTVDLGGAAEDDPDTDDTVGVSDEARDLPDITKLIPVSDGRGFTLRYGKIIRDDEDHSLTRRQIGLAVNISVRSAIATGDVVDENGVVRRAVELFPNLSDSEIEDIRASYRRADDVRMNAGTEWSDAVRNGVRWSFAEESKEDEDTSSDNFNNKALAEYNSDAIEDFLALAQRSTPETGRNLQGFLKLIKSFARKRASEGGAAKFVSDLLNPRMNDKADTQALHSAYLLMNLDKFDSDDIGSHISDLLKKDASGNAKSRRAAFLLSYLASLPRNARCSFGILCATSVAATPVHVGKQAGFMDVFRRSSGGKVPQSIVVDSFPGLVGASPSRARELAERLIKAHTELVRKGLPGDSMEANAKAVADVIASVFGRESPLVSALTSDMAVKQWTTLRKSTRDKLLDALTVTGAEGSVRRIPLLATIEDALAALSTVGADKLDRFLVADTFIAAAATGSAESVGVRSAPCSPFLTDALYTFLSCFQDALPVTIMHAEIDPSRDRKGSSVAVAPRDMIPLLSRWLYADADTVLNVIVDGKKTPVPSFAEVCRRFFPGVTDEVISECRQDGTWPDDARTPICAKCLSTSLSANEVYHACEVAYSNDDLPVYWIPIYAGDHASSTLLQVPRAVTFGYSAPATTPGNGVSESSPASVAPINVWYGTGENRELSNLAERPFTYDGRKYVSVEHAYQTLKSGAFDESVYSADWAAGKKITGKAEADTSSNVKLMRGLVLESFRQNPSAAAKLVATGDAAFTHTQDGGIWKTEFPKALELAREALRGDATLRKVPDASYDWYPPYGFDYNPGNYVLTPARPGAAVAKATAKDQRKFNVYGGITKFIGYGSAGSSTRHYADTTFSGIANKGDYTKSDIVGVSVNGAGKDRIPLSDPRVMKELRAAMEAGATIIADTKEYREKSKYNVGERELTEYLDSNGYVELYKEGVWVPAAIPAATNNDELDDLFPEETADPFDPGSATIEMVDDIDFSKMKTLDGKPIDMTGDDIGLFSDADFSGAPEKDGKLKDNASARTRGQYGSDRAAAPAAPAAKPSYTDLARAACSSIGLSLMFTDTKRSAISSLEAQGVGMIGVSESTDANGKTERKVGENRIHIVRNWGDPTGKNEAFIGSTFIRGYGAEAIKRIAADPRLATLKVHLISTYGPDLFFVKSLAVSVDGETEDFLPGSAPKAMNDYITAYRGAADPLSTDLVTDFDSYKVGPAGSKALTVRTENGERKVMAAAFDRIADAVVSSDPVLETLRKDASADPSRLAAFNEKLAEAFKARFGSKVTGEELDDLVGELDVSDKVRGDRKARLSEILPGATVMFVPGVNGAMLDLSYQENGAMAYPVANVSHTSVIPSEAGVSPRNYEVDAITMANTLEVGGWLRNSATARTVRELVANWGLLVNSVTSDPAYISSVLHTSDAIKEMLRACEDPNGQNIVQELSRQVWAEIRKGSNLPMVGIDAPLVSCGAAVVKDDGLFTHSVSPMHQAMMKGSELFSEEESRFYGVDRRMALCNVNCSSKGFRYTWFLDEGEFGKSETMQGYMNAAVGLYKASGGDVGNLSHGRMVALALAAAFTDLNGKLKTKVGADRQKEAALRDEIKALRRAIASCFVDHHGTPISADERRVNQFSVEDLFMAKRGDGVGDEFDLSAVQCEGVDLVHNDATGKDHIVLGGTMFGLPRTPSYNGSMWLQTVRAGLPVTERKVERDGKTVYAVGRTAMVSPDPYTNKILGCDHDGDKTKLYMFHGDAEGRVSFANLPSPVSSDGNFDEYEYVSTGKLRKDYLDKVASANVGSGGRKGFLTRCWVDPDTGEEVEIGNNDKRENSYLRISAVAKKMVSNNFVRCLFNMSRSLPVDRVVDLPLGGIKLERRMSSGADKPRLKFIGGVASSATNPFPVTSDGARSKLLGGKEEANAGPRKLADDGSLGNLGMPDKAADITTDAGNAADARAVAVSWAKTLHMVRALGVYAGRGLAALTSADASEWLRFMYRIDGISNATFDDIKEQICGRLGWTKGMMDSVITVLISNSVSGDRLPVTEGDFAGTLGAYARDVRNKGSFYWALKATDRTDEGSARTIRLGTFGRGKIPSMSEFASMCRLKPEVTESGKIIYEEDVDGYKTSPTVLGAVLRGYLRGAGADLEANDEGRGKLIQRFLSMSLAAGGHNAVLGRLYHQVSTAAKGKSGDAVISAAEASAVASAASGHGRAMSRFMRILQSLQSARSICNAVNYLQVDNGDNRSQISAVRNAEAYGRYAGDPGTLMRRMRAATALAEDARRLVNGVVSRLETVASKALFCAEFRNEGVIPHVAKGQVGEDGVVLDARGRLAGRLILRDGVSSYDTMAAEANAQQLPYIAGYFGRAASELAADVAGRKLVSGLAIAKSLDALALGNEKHPTLAMRRSIESVLAVMYRLITSSSEFRSAGGNKAVAYIRSAADSAYGVVKMAKSKTAVGARARNGKKGAYSEFAEDKVINVYPYGEDGYGLSRVMPMFRANDAESIDHIRDLFDDIITGKAYAGRRTISGNGQLTSCRTFAVTTESVCGYAAEFTGAKPGSITTFDEMKAAIASYVKKNSPVYAAEAKANAKKANPRPEEAILMRVPEYSQAITAYNAAAAFSAATGGVELTPAVLFGQILPAHTLLTTRTLGAPSPTSASLLALLPKRYYRSISSAATALERNDGPMTKLLISSSYAEVRDETAELTAAKGNKEVAPVTKRRDEDLRRAVGVGNISGKGDGVKLLIADIRGGDTEARENPDYRNTVDLLSDGTLTDLVDWAATASAEGYERIDISGHDAGATAGQDTVPPEVRSRIEKTAAAMGVLLGSWATVEYGGGSTFTIRGRLRGAAGSGKEVVILVDAGEGDILDSPEKVRAYAESISYANSLCSAVNLGTITRSDGTTRRFDANDFMSLPLEVRESLVRKYNIGGATYNKLAWVSDGRGLAILAGAIRIPGNSGTKIYHEYFHSMMRMFEQIGLFGEQDYKALAERFGSDPSGKHRFNEEAAAEAFRKWVEGNTDAEAKEVRGVFRKILDFINAFFEAMCRGFDYGRRDADEYLFKMMVYGFAQPSNSRIGEITAAAPEAKDAADVRSRVKKAFTLARHSDIDVKSDKSFVDQLTEKAMSGLDASLGKTRSLEDIPGVEGIVSAEDAAASAALTKKALEVLSGSHHASAAEIREVLSDLAAARRNMANDVADVVDISKEIPGIDLTVGEPTEPEAAEPRKPIDPVKKEVRKVVYPQVEVNDFYRAGDFIAAAVEAGLEPNGKWEVPLQQIVAHYDAPSWEFSSDADLERRIVAHGIRRAMVTLNPEAAKKLTDDDIMRSLAFEAALRMYGAIDRSFVKQTNVKGGKAVEAFDVYDKATHASMYQVSAWVTATRPMSPTIAVRDALARVAELRALNAELAGEENSAEGEFAYIDDKLRELEKITSDPTSLMELQYGQQSETLNYVIGSLKAGTKRATYDENGFMEDIMPIDVNDPEGELDDPENINTYNPLSPGHLENLLGNEGNPHVQEALKLALMTAYQVAAQVKFYREIDVIPMNDGDFVARNQMMRRHRLPANVSIAEWLAQQAIGDSNLLDDQGIVDHMDQPYFIANNAEAWLDSLIRKSFGAVGNIGEMLSAENGEYAAIKHRIADLENFMAMAFGMNGEDGHRLLKVIHQRGEFKLEDGAVVRRVGDEYVKFDNYNRQVSEFTMSEDDLRTVDLFLKMVSAHAGKQKFVITGVNDIHFDRGMSRKPGDYDADAIRRKYESKDRGRMNSLEIACYRMLSQLPDSVLFGDFGLYDRFVRGAISAMATADEYLKNEIRRRRLNAAYARQASREEIEKIKKETVSAELDFGSAVYNSVAIDSLVGMGLVEGLCRNDERYEGSYLRKFTSAVVKVSCDEINDLFLNSDAYDKLTSVKRGWRSREEAAAFFDRDRVRDEFMAVYSDAVKFVRRHPWLVHGDGQYFHGFDTVLPFWRGTGVFMYNAVRSLRDIDTERLSYMPKEAKIVNALLQSDDADVPVVELELDKYAGAFELLANRYKVEMHGKPLVDAIANGEFEAGRHVSDRTGLVLPSDAKLRDVVQAIYSSYVEEMWNIQTGNSEGKLIDIEDVLSLFESTRYTRGELLGGSLGMNDERVYRTTGALPANYQIGHKVHVAIDGITNAMMSRAVMANLLMTPAADGSPVYFANPSDLAAETSGLPDEFWGQIARWWSDYFELTDHAYDEAKSGIQNARDIYKFLKTQQLANNGRIRNAVYRPIGRDDGDIASVDEWLVRDDDQLGDESSAINAIARGEAMGYLKQFLQAGRVLGFGSPAVRAWLHRGLSWSKSLSVSFSFFFPLATRWESPIGAVGAMATMCSNSKTFNSIVHERPEVFAAVQKMFSGRGWITADFLGFQDIMRMMDSNDPFLAELKSWASALGITLSSNLVNPMEQTKGVMAEDITRMKEAIRDHFDAKTAAKFGRIMDAMLLRQGDKAFNYALNATKLAVVAQLAMKLRHEALAKGKAFDPIRDLRKYSRYLNAEIGGIDPLRYAWAHPMMRGLMNCLMFSWQWTRGAWEAGGGTVLEDALFGGHTMTRQEREYMFGRWCRMFGTVMIGVPMMMQALVLAAAKCIGGGDDGDDKWWTWENEDKTKWTAFDLTPLLKAIDKADETHLGGILRRVKENGGAAGAVIGGAVGAVSGALGGNWLTGALGGVLGAGVGSMAPSMIPLYTGNDAANSKTRNRRYYMHFGKQGWEFFRWFDDAWSQFFSKLSMPTQRLLEGFAGRSLGYLDRSLAWDDMGQFERWILPTTDSALFNVAQAFLPFSVGGINRNGDAGVLPIFGPVQMGASETAIQKRLEKAVAAWAHNDRSGYAYGGPRRTKRGAKETVRNGVADILRDAETNGLDPKAQLDKAIGTVLSKEYAKFFRALPDRPGGDVDAKEINRIARSLHRLTVRKSQVLKSIKDRLENRKTPWEDLSDDSREMYRSIVRNSWADPFRAGPGGDDVVEY